MTLSFGSTFRHINRHHGCKNFERAKKRRHTFKLIEPTRDAVEGSAAANVVDDEGAKGAAVVSGGDGAETLLAGGVPNLGLHFFAVDFKGLGLELHANCGLGVQVELVAGVAGQQIGFPHRRVADDHHLEEILLSLVV